jgi:putative endonuclease
MKEWYVYIILCSDHSLYTGITTDIKKRYTQHCSGVGAKYFRMRRPIQLVYLENRHTRSSASRREICIKSLNRVAKMELLELPGNQFLNIFLQS